MVCCNVLLTFVKKQSKCINTFKGKMQKTALVCHLATCGIQARPEHLKLPISM